MKNNSDQPRRRVLIVDDSSVFCKVMERVLQSNPRLTVVGTAPNGRIALQRIEELQPDVVTLDIEMPEMDGFQTLDALKAAGSKLPVIVVSDHTERGAQITMKALLSGALDYITKPGGPESTGPGSAEKIADKVLAVADRSAAYRRREGKAPATAPRARARRSGGTGTITKAPRIDAVVIGASTGGPNALATVIPALGRELSVPVFIVQHMPALFTANLARSLDAQSRIHVQEGAEGRKARPGEVWIAPGNYHMEIEGRSAPWTLKLNQGPEENFCRPAVDVLFRSAARQFGKHVLAVVLTGMGQDGLLGCHKIHQAGGQILIQDEETSVVWGMPGAIADSDLPYVSKPIGEIGPEIMRRVAQRVTTV